MTPTQRTQLEQLHQIKVSLFKCYLIEGKFALFLMDCLEKHSSDLSVDELFKLKDYSNRVHALLGKIKASDDFLQDNSSDADFTEPSQRLCQVLVWPF